MFKVKDSYGVNQRRLVRLFTTA